MINVHREENDKEWIQRRQIRLVQVRKQSNDIAKQLRMRANNEEQEWKIQKENEVGMRLELWKMQKLKDLHELYRDAVSHIGVAHKLADEEPEENGRNEDKKRALVCRARERGESAMDRVLREKKEAIKKKLIPIQRKLITRRIEDIRSSLVRSISAQKSDHSRKTNKKPFHPKLFQSSYEDEEENYGPISPKERHIGEMEKRENLPKAVDYIIGARSDCGKRKLYDTRDSSRRAQTRSDTVNVNSFLEDNAEDEKVWINLGEVEAITKVEADDEIERMETKIHQEKEGCNKKIMNITSKRKITSERNTESNVECLGYSFHHKCNMKIDTPSVVKIDKQSEPDPIELARQDEKQLEEEKKEKEGKIILAAKRGHKAIEKVKITRDYNELLVKLEKLSAKEKMIKTYCHFPLSDMFMSDERRLEKSKRRQRIMDSKFEKIYYETMRMDLNHDLGGNGECNTGRGINNEKTTPEYKINALTKLDFCESERNRMTNSPSLSYHESQGRNEIDPVEKVTVDKTKSCLRFERTKIRGDIALSDLDRLLERTRKLREESHLNKERPFSECNLITSRGDRHQEKLERKEMAHSELHIPTSPSDLSELTKSVILSPVEDKKKLDYSKKEENKKWYEFEKETVMDLGMGDLGSRFPGIRTNTIAWPVMASMNNPDEVCDVSSSTTYRELPSQFLPKRINSLLKLLAKLKEREGMSLAADELIVKMETTLDALITEAERNNVTLDREQREEYQFNPQLNYYISKLLTMSRETVSNLNVTSDGEVSMVRGDETDCSESSEPSTPNVTPVNKYLKQINQSNKFYNVKRAKDLEKAVMKWKRILESSIEGNPSSSESCETSYGYEPDCDGEDNNDDFGTCDVEEEESEEACYPGGATYVADNNHMNRIEEVSKKCSECIAGISSILANAMKEVSGKCHQCGGLNKQFFNTNNCQKVPTENFLNRLKDADTYCSKRTTPEDDFGGAACNQAGIELMDSVPDIMDALMAKGILTSPFNNIQSEVDNSHCSECCPICQRQKLGKKEPKPFRCKSSCKGACNPRYVPGDTPVETEEMRRIRKKLEIVPMKYLDQCFGIYSPIPMPRPFMKTPPLDESAMRRNFGQPLFACGGKSQAAENFKRRLNFTVKVDDNSDSVPKEAACPTPEPVQAACVTEAPKRPTSSPNGVQEDDQGGSCYPTSAHTTFDDSLEPAPCPKPSPPKGGLDEKYFRPVDPLSPELGLGKYFKDDFYPQHSMDDRCFRPRLPLLHGLDEKRCHSADRKPPRRGMNQKQLQSAVIKPAPCGLDEKYFRPATPEPEPQPAPCGLDEKYFRPAEPLPAPCGSGQKQLQSAVIKPAPCGLDEKYFRPATPEPQSKPGPCAIDEKYFRPASPEREPAPGGLDEKYFRAAEPLPAPCGSGQKQLQSAVIKPAPCGLDEKYFRPATPEPEPQPGTCAIDEKYFRPATPETQPAPRGLDEKYFRPATPEPEPQPGTCAIDEKYFRPATPETQPAPRGLDEKYFRPATSEPEPQPGTCAIDEKYFRPFESKPASRCVEKCFRNSAPARRSLDDRYFRPNVPLPRDLGDRGCCQSADCKPRPCLDDKYFRPAGPTPPSGIDKYFRDIAPSTCSPDKKNSRLATPKSDQHTGKLNMSEVNGQESDRREVNRQDEGNEVEVYPVAQGCSKLDVVEKENQAAEITELPGDVMKSIEKDFEYLKRVTNVDRDLLYSLLLAQANNSKRLDTIMSDILGFPPGSEVFTHTRDEDPDRELQRMGIEGHSEKFLRRVREMFPDVNMEFLTEECQNLDTEEDLARFINTVMISGVYPKRSSIKDVGLNTNSNAEGDKAQFLDGSPAKSVSHTSDQEISSSGIIESRHRKRRRTRSLDCHTNGAGPSTSAMPVEPTLVFINPFKYINLEQHGYYRFPDHMLDEINGLEPNQPEPPNNNHEDSEENEGSKVTMNWDVIKICSNVDDDSAEESSPRTKSKNTRNVKLTNNKQKISKSGESIAKVATTSTDSTETGEAEQDEDISEDWVNEQTAELIRLFPNTDPSFLREECVKFRGSLEAMNEFVIAKLEDKNMPTRADYEKRMELVELQNRYTYNFSIEDFLKVIPDPWTYFSNSEKRNCAKYKVHSIIFLKTAFRKVYSRIITDTLMKNNFNLYLSYKELKERSPNGRIRGRSDAECMQRPATIDIQFLQEAAFIRNERKIRDFIQTREDGKKLRFEEAKKNGTLIECQCCFDSEILVEDIVYCPKNHAVCKSCVIKYVEVELGEAKCQFSCLTDCDEKYTLTALQTAVKPELFSKIIQANQMEEIQAAGIEDLVHCPFCNYATIMPPEVKVLPCLNPECQKESCRICKELSHIPLRCEEVEKSEEVRMRTYIENKMTEALVRKCYKCGKAFVKEGGCNKMVCSCGARMCYICRKPVRDYSHFNGQGGTNFDRCPLYSTNDELHVDIVERVAEQAKAEVLEANPNRKLKHDPTMVLPERTYDRPMVGMNPGAALAVGLLAVGNLPFHLNRGELLRRRVNNNMAPRNREHPFPYRVGIHRPHNYNLRNRNRARAVIRGHRNLRNRENRVN